MNYSLKIKWDCFRLTRLYFLRINDAYTWYELDFCNVGVYFKMAKSSRMNRLSKYVKESNIKSMVHVYKTLQYSLEMGSLCLGEQRHNGRTSIKHHKASEIISFWLHVIFEHYEPCNTMH